MARWEGLLQANKLWLKRMQKVRDEAAKKLAGRKSQDYPQRSPEWIMVRVLERHIAEAEKAVEDLARKVQELTEKRKKRAMMRGYKAPFASQVLAIC